MNDYEETIIKRCIAYYIDYTDITVYYRYVWVDNLIKVCFRYALKVNIIKAKYVKTYYGY